MLDIKSLERRWLKYKLKSFTPYFIVIFLLLSSVVGLFLWLKSEKTIQAPIVNNVLNTPTKKIVKTTLVPIIDNNATILEPSMDFVQSFQNTSIPEEASVAPLAVKNKPVRSTPPSPKILTVPEYSPPPITPTVSKVISSDKSLSINRNESKLDINDLQRRFKETSNANLGLFIARYYYEHGNYDEAYNYALKTNNVNNRIDESWIIFSKSLVKLGRTDQAKKTLQLYISQSNSEAARGLLDSIERGSFK